MKRFLKDYRLHEHTEALFLLTLGIIIQVLDGSPFDVWERWSLAWETEFPREFFSALIQQIIKTVLSMIILVRCMTTVLYVLFGFIVIYCILRETSPKLMLPWLFIAGLKSVLLTFCETLTGVYVCSAFGKIRKPCVEFVVSKAIELFFAIYLWACIRSIHKDLEQFEENCREEELLTKMVIHRVNLRRRRARSMIDESTLHKTSNLNYFALKDVPNIIIDMLKTEEELSQDSLLSPGMMLSSVSNMGSYDYLKTSLSLGELGVIDLSGFQIAGLDDRQHLSPSARAMKFLKLTRDDVKKAKERTRSITFAENYKSPKEVPRNLTEVKPSTILNRTPRQKEMFVATLPELEKVKEHLSRKKKQSTFQGDILADIDNASQVEIQASAEQFVGLEDGDEEDEEGDNGSIAVTAETDDETTPNLWFMTNIKDQVNRIGLVENNNSRRSDNYQRLYRQEYMSMIGEEVFGKKKNLPKPPSLSDIGERSEDENDSELVYQSSSRNTDIEPSEEYAQTSKKKKKLIFENHLGTPTAMPLTVIVTNFPIQLDSRVPKCETVYYRETVVGSARILLLPDGTVEPRLETCHGEGSSRHSTDNVFESSATAVSTEPEDLSYIEEGQDGIFAQAEDQTNLDKANLYMLKCTQEMTPDFWHDHHPHKSELLTSRANRDIAVLWREEAELPMITSSDVINDSNHVHPRLSEQMMFIRDMMRRPIRDVLRTYYHLREAESETPGLKKNCSHLYENFMTMKSICKTNTSAVVQKSAAEFEKIFADCGTQVSCYKDGLKSTENIALRSPKSTKLKTNGNNILPATYLFGNRDLGWASSSMEVSPGRAQGKLKELGGVTSTRSLPEGATARISSSDAPCKMLLPPNHRNILGKDSMSSLKDQISDQAIPMSDDNQSIYNADSDESFSLFYSKTADLASPLLDTRRFIYPDHIHYSYKNVKKKGFDVELNGGLPLLVRDSLTLNPSMNLKRMDTPPDPQTGITRRPMDLTFANMDVFPKQPKPSTSHDSGKNKLNHFKIPELLTDSSCELKPRLKTMKKEQKWLKKFLKLRNSDDYVETSSTNLHSNKGRAGVLSNPASVVHSSKLKKKFQRSRLKNTAGRF